MATVWTTGQPGASSGMATSPLPGGAIDCNFVHYRHVFDDDLLRRWSSPHFSVKERGDALRSAILRTSGTPIADRHLLFQRPQVVCANEVFPESALADPLADLEIWDEWRQGIRAFPYPGRFSRLGIKKQEQKVSSTTSMGVLGEIFTGLFGQQGISPWVLVRPIRRWPDFIHATCNHRYAFVESKAFYQQNDQRFALPSVPKALFFECLDDAVRQLNSDPWVQVWLAFTEIRSIVPFVVSTIFLELDVSDAKRAKVPHKMPPAVIAGLAEQVLRYAAAEIESQASLEPAGAGSDDDIKDYRRSLLQRARGSIDEALRDLPLNRDAVLPYEDISDEIGKQVKRLAPPDSTAARRYADAKRRAALGVLASIRSVGIQELLLADMPRETREMLNGAWHPSWERANQPWQKIGDVPLWRCSSAVLGLAGKELDGSSLPRS